MLQRLLLKASGIILPGLCWHWVHVCSDTGITKCKAADFGTSSRLLFSKRAPTYWKETKRNFCVWSGFTFPYILHSFVLGFSFSSSRGLCFFTKYISSRVSLLAVSYIFGSVLAAADNIYNQNAIVAPRYLKHTFNILLKR